MTESPHTEPPRNSQKSARPRIIAASVIGLVAVVGLFILFSGSAEDTAPAPAAITNATADGDGIGGLAFVDGTLLVVENTRLVLRPLDTERDAMEFVIRREDASNFDIAHMQSHSAVALPTRIYYEREGETLLAKYKEDAPVNSQQQGGS
jgi:hypothetical protein